MKKFIPIASLFCLISTFQPSYGMEKNAEAKEAKAQTATSTIQEQKEHDGRRTLEQQNLKTFQGLLHDTLNRFRQQQKIALIVGKLSTNEPVAYDPTTQTFHIDRRIAHKTFFPITDSETWGKAIPPAYFFYAYWLIRQHLNTIRNSKDNYLATINTTLKYLLLDHQYDAVIYAVIKNLEAMFKKQTRIDTLPTYNEEYESIRAYLKKEGFVLKQQLFKQTHNAVLVALDLNRLIIDKKGIQHIIPLYKAGFTQHAVSDSIYESMRQILHPECKSSSGTSQIMLTQAHHENTTVEEHKDVGKGFWATLVSLFTGRKSS